MIIKRITLLICSVSLCCILQAQPLLTKEQEEVQQTVIHFFDALSNRDSISLKKHSTKDIVLYESGAIWNADTLIQKAITLNAASDFKRSNNFDFISTTVTKNIAWATYHLQSETTKNSKHANILWLETVVLIKERRKWKIKVLHSTLIKRT